MFHSDQWFSNRPQLYQYLSTVFTLYNTSIYRELIIRQKFNQPTNDNGLIIFSFLKLHDKRHKKLWFLWNSGYEALRCGCIGGTAFFGNNINGPKFFKPSAQDIQDGINIARYQYASFTFLYPIDCIIFEFKFLQYQHEFERVWFWREFTLRESISFSHTALQFTASVSSRVLRIHWQNEYLCVEI